MAGACLCAMASEPDFVLTAQCPGSFELALDGTCRLRSLYDAYGAAEGHGGMQVSLPPARHGFTPRQIDLGRHLFFDPLLARDASTSCAHCHDPAHGWSDGRRTAAGRGGSGVGAARDGGALLTRRTPTLWNVAFQERFFWDGRAASLEEQSRGPLFSHDEMDNTPADLMARLNGNATYRRLFAQAYQRDGSDQIALPDVEHALAAFQSTLVSLNSRYDRYAHGDRSALNELEIAGLNVFRGFVARCSQCHTPPLFASNDLAVVGAPASPGQPIDAGAGGLGGDPGLRGAFKVPTLRNVTRSGPPYFHAGQFSSLHEVVGFYNARRGHALPRHERQSLHWHVHMSSPQLGRNDERAIVAFLGALEDESLLPVIPRNVPSGLPVLSALGSAGMPKAR